MTPRTMIQPVRRAAVLAAAALAYCAPFAAAKPRSETATATLKIDPVALSWANTLRMGDGFDPAQIQLGPARPKGIKKEPHYRTAPLYGVLRVGNGLRSAHVVAADEPSGEDARIYIDLNGNGDLTDDGTGKWPKRVVGDNATTYSGTWVFRASYGTATKETSSASYGLNLSRDPDRAALTYFRAAERYGKIRVRGKSYSVLLTEDANDGVFNKRYNEKNPSLRGVWLGLGSQPEVDARGTFTFAGRLYLARISADGSRLTLEPTTRVVKAPVPGRPVERPLLKAGTEAPDFTVPMADGGTFHLADTRGTIVLVDFWATWCGPCQRSLPHLQKLYERVKDHNVAVIAVNVWDDNPAYEKWVPAHPEYTFPIARDPAGRDSKISIASLKYQVSGIPTSYVIGPDGKVVAAIVGVGGDEDHRIEDVLAKLGVSL